MGDRRLGLTLGLEGASLGSALELCRHAEELGYTDVWSAEVGGADGFSPLAALAVTTRSVRLGTAIVPVFTRPPALLGMSAATLQELSGGRFVLGLGTSSSIIVERWMGSHFERPLERERAYIEVLRRILSGEKVDYENDGVRTSSFRLQLPVSQPVPLYLAALGPQACRMAGAIADGVIFFLKTPGGVRQALGWVADGARSAGRDPAEIDSVMRVPVIVDEDDRGSVETAARWIVTSYCFVDVYNRSLAAQGFEDDARKIRELWSKDKGEAMNAVSKELLEELLVFGDRSRRNERLEAFREAGIKTLVLQPISVAGDDAAKAERIAASVEQHAP